MNRGVIFCLFLFFSAMGGMLVYLNFIRVKYDLLTLLIVFSLATIVLLPRILDTEEIVETERIE